MSDDWDDVHGQDATPVEETLISNILDQRKHIEELEAQLAAALLREKALLNGTEINRKTDLRTAARHRDERTKDKREIDDLKAKLAEKMEDDAYIAELEGDYGKRGERIEELQLQLKIVLDREAATFALYDAKLDAADAKLEKAVEALGDMEKVQRSEASTGILKVMIRYTLAEMKGQDDE